MSFTQIFSIGNRIEELAINKALTLEILFENPKTPVIARQSHPNLIDFLIDNIENLVSNAIGENSNATEVEINMSMELLLFSSVDFSQALSSSEGKGNLVIQHIISIMMNQEEPNLFFVNAMKILIFMINFSNGEILSGIDDSYYFLRQVLTLNTSMILDDLMFVILEHETAFKNWALSFDILSLFENLLSTPSYSSNFYRITAFYQRFLYIFKNDQIEAFESPGICQSLFTIGINFSCLNGLGAIDYIIKKNSESKDESKINGLLGLISQNIDFFIGSVTQSGPEDSSYIFGPLQKISLSIMTFYVQYDQADWIFEIAGFLWDQFLLNPTNSSLHNSYLSYLRAIKKYETNFEEFVYKANFLDIIPDIFSKQQIIRASFFGQLIEISKIIKETVTNGKIVQQVPWSQFSKTILKPKLLILQKEYLGPDPKKNCYQKDHLDPIQSLRDSLDIDNIDSEVNVDKKIEFGESDSYDYAIFEEEEEEEEE